MKQGYQKFSFLKIYQSIWGQWLISASMTLLVLCFIFAFIPVIFMTNDDYALMACINGLATGSPFYICSYTNPIFSHMMAGLYSFTLSVNWYVLYHYFILFFGVTTIGSCFFQICFKKGIKCWKSVIVFSWILLALLFYPMYTPSFTLTPTIGATAAVALIFTVNLQQNKKKIQIFYYILSTLFLFFSFILRSDSTYVCLCFGGLAIVYHILKIYINNGDIHSKDIYRVILFIIITLILLIGASILKKIEINKYSDFYAFNKARSLYEDYPHPSYTEMQDIYHEYGITEELATLLNSWYFSDKKITTQALQSLVEESRKIDRNSFSKAVQVGINLIRYDKFSLSAVLILFFLGIYFFYCVAQAELRKKYWIELLTVLCAFGGAFVLCFYLCWIRRFLLKSFFSVSIPCTISIIFLLFQVFDERVCLSSDFRSFSIFKFSEKYIGIWKKAIVIFIFFIMILTCYKPVHYSLHSSVRAERKTAIKQDQIFWKYITDHADNLYMFDPYATPNATLFPEKIHLLRNHAVWGGYSYYHAPVFNEQLSIIGKKSFNFDVLLENNIYYIPNFYYPEIIYNILAYMCQEYYVPVAEIIDYITVNQPVYQFHALTFDKDYTGWLHNHDRHYYIKRGVIQTGWFQINGNTYFGIPPVAEYTKSINSLQRIQYYNFYSNRIDKKEYLISTGNSVATGWMYIDGDTYFFDSDGVMQTGWVYSEDLGWRYLKQDGKLLHDDWLVTKNRQYYFDSNGKIYTISFKDKLNAEPLPQGAAIAGDLDLLQRKENYG